MTQYQNIIAELKGEIGRLKDKINSDAVRKLFWKSFGFNNLPNWFQNDKSSPATKQQIEELKLLRDALVANFKEQMKLRWEKFLKITLRHNFVTFHIVYFLVLNNQKQVAGYATSLMQLTKISWMNLELMIVTIWCLTV